MTEASFTRRYAFATSGLRCREKEPPMQLKRAEDIVWQDLPKIEDPFFAQSDIKQVFFDRYNYITWDMS
jgi:hypothetical protein